MKKTIRKLLIANRSEIALRIMRTAQSMGIQCVAIYSNSDAHSLHVRQADEAYPLNNDQPALSYLNSEAIINIARQSCCDAIHPGYGFLAENAAFSKACEQAGIIFVGPQAEVIELMGDKSKAKTFAKANDIPVIPGEEKLEQTLENFKKVAKNIGTPLLVKASAGGGGKGMKLVRELKELESAYNSAKRESLAAFGDDHLLIEKYFDLARHVEVQVLADQYKNVIHLFDRDCSLQRRHQKIIEEAPAYGLSTQCREAMYACAIKLCQLINYQGAGTLEFLLDENENFYLMEMNTRLQVEHAVSEQITGIDIVEQQILIAEGKALPFTQEHIHCQGHSIEARVYAEQCRNDFLPASGTIDNFHLAAQGQQVRIDHALYQGLHITPLYDPMIGKIAAWGKDRDSAIQNLSQAITNTHITGLESNRNFILACIQHPAFKANKLSTKFIDTHLDSLLEDTKAVEKIDLYSVCSDIFSLANKALQQLTYPDRQYSPWYHPQSDSFPADLSISLHDQKLERSQKTHDIQFELQSIWLKENGRTLKGKFAAQQKPDCYGLFSFELKKNKQLLAKLNVSSSFGDYELLIHKPQTGKVVRTQQGSKDYLAPLNGKVIALYVSEGEQVSEGQELVVLEAMKMEHVIKARANGKIKKLNITQDQQVSADQALFSIDATENTEATTA